MIKFFRKVRLKLLSENKFNRYLIYAFGEIFLVVIGILIALQINNLNEQNKFEKEYISDLKAIKENLIKDSLSISANLRNGRRYAKEFETYLTNNTLVINGSSIISKIGSPGLYFDDSGYNNALNKKTLNLIQIDSLNNLFHEYYVRLIGIIQKHANKLEHNGAILKRYYLESGQYNEGKSKQKIMNALMQQGPFLDYLNLYLSNRDETIETLVYMKDLNTRLCNTIDLELSLFE